MWYDALEDTLDCGSGSESDADTLELFDWRVPGDQSRLSLIAENEQLTREKEDVDGESVPFAAKLALKNVALGLFGTVPPPKKFDSAKLKEIAGDVAGSVAKLKPDGVIIYDIQDEPSRNGSERPFPFFHTHAPSEFARLLKKAQPSLDPIVYRALASGETESEFSYWIEDAKVSGLNNFVLVGGKAAEGEEILSVDAAAHLIKKSERGMLLGGITIPERHRNKLDEHLRVYNKVFQGVGFFTSQVVYNVDNAIWFLQDYDELCKAKNVEPVRIFFTFAPFGSEKTAKFMEWLGVEVPPGTQKRVLSRPNTKSRVIESMNICWENWKRILDACKRLEIRVPLGVSVEAVSKSKLESTGAMCLYSSLMEQLKEYYSEQQENTLLKILSKEGTYIVQTDANHKLTVTSLLSGSPPTFLGTFTTPGSDNKVATRDDNGAPLLDKSELLPRVDSGLNLSAMQLR